MTTRKDSLDESVKSESSVKQVKAKRLGTISTVLKIIEEDGIMAFWQGVIPALILVINPIIQYTSFEQLKVQLEKFKKLGNLDFFLLGATIYKNVEVQQVNIAATSGDMGILASHVPSIEQLKPGVIEVIENANTTKKFFVSGGFAIINPNSSLDINVVEAFPLEEFSPERAATSGSSEEERNIAKVEVEVLESLQSALSK
ncbi:18021_t:CDS:2 [Racocetra fulgida]|uniref:ATP synthase subunit delta, mitochondrial n=1 Tax=Racocetra fulgida TaxID=60492 RepID=A0A9N9BTR8_9GLOM|nr:18021_t:CDS:2 [Racocetra fulgida]